MPLTRARTILMTPSTCPISYDTDYVQGELVSVESLVSFKELDIDVFSNETFKKEFTSSFIQAMAQSAGCDEEDVTVHGIMAGSVKVNSTVILSDVSEQSNADAFTEKLANDTARCGQGIPSDSISALKGKRSTTRMEQCAYE
eukprot:gene11835-13971_t